MTIKFEDLINEIDIRHEYDVRAERFFYNKLKVNDETLAEELKRLIAEVANDVVATVKHDGNGLVCEIKADELVFGLDFTPVCDCSEEMTAAIKRYIVEKVRYMYMAAVHPEWAEPVGVLGKLEIKSYLKNAVPPKMAPVQKLKRKYILRVKEIWE